MQHSNLCDISPAASFAEVSPQSEEYYHVSPSAAVNAARDRVKTHHGIQTGFMSSVLQ